MNGEWCRMKQIEIAVKGKIACLVDPKQYLVCDNNDYEVVFRFDEEWQGVTAKTALFVFGDGEPIAVPFDGEVCEGVSIHDALGCAIGVYAGALKTSTGAYISCLPSIREGAASPVPPPAPEVYDRIMELLDKAMQAHTELPKGGAAGQVLKKKTEKDYDVEWVDDKTLDPDLYAKKADLEPLSDDIAEHGEQIEALGREDGFIHSHLQQHDLQIGDLFVMYDGLSKADKEHDAQIARLAQQGTSFDGLFGEVFLRVSDLEVAVGSAQQTLSEVVDGGAFV